jgi:hypothetical protein
MPSHLTVHTYSKVHAVSNYHSSIPAHCKYSIGTGPVYNFLLCRFLIFISYVFLFYLICSITLLLITALLGLELARKAFSLLVQVT